MDVKDLIKSSPQFVKGNVIELSKDKQYINEFEVVENITGLLLVKEGDGYIKINGEEYMAKRGTLFILQQGLKYIETMLPFNLLYLCFSNLQIEGMPANFLIVQRKMHVIHLAEGITDYEFLMEQIIHERQGGLPEATIIVNGWLAVLIGRLVQRLHHSHNPSKKKYSTSVKSILIVKQLIEERYSENLTLGQLADEVFLSPYHLCRQFKRKTGWTPGQYIIHCRLQTAKHLLTTTDETMEQIAGKIGYQSETHFYQVFKNNSGITPGHYRVMKRGENGR